MPKSINVVAANAASNSLTCMSGIMDESREHYREAIKGIFGQGKREKFVQGGHDMNGVFIAMKLGIAVGLRDSVDKLAELNSGRKGNIRLRVTLLDYSIEMMLQQRCCTEVHRLAIICGGTD